MSILKNNLRLAGSPVQSGKCSTNSRVGHLVCAVLLAGFILLFGGNAKAYNVLVNPSAETGDLTGWNISDTGYIFVVSTNDFVPNEAAGGSTTENILGYNGKYVFELFNTTATSTYIYQDFAAVGGSEWSASTEAICYASNYFNGGADAHMQIVFYDISNNVVPDPNSNFGSGGGGGVYGSDFLDPAPPPVSWIYAPPMAVDATGWQYLTPTNLYDTDPATEASYDATLSTPPTLPLTAPPGTAKVRFQIEFDNAGTDGGAVYWASNDLEKIKGSDPDITNPPVAVTIYAGLPASFTVVAVRSAKSELLTYQWQFNGANLPPAGGVNNISGPTTNPSLSFTNVQGVDSGLYDVVVTDTNGFITSVPVPLTVLTLSPLEKANALGANAGFENAPDWPIWEPFNGAYFANDTNVYGTSTTTVDVYDGNWCALIGANGDRDNGIYAQLPAAPGSLWKAGGWAYISSLNDFYDGNTCRLQIWFLTGVGGGVAANTSTYESFKLYGLGYTNADEQYTNIDTSSSDFGDVEYHAQLARDQWVYMPVTNVVNNGGIGLGDDLPYDTLPNGYFMVPTNSGAINYQVYEYCPLSTDIPTPQADAGGSASDAVYWDDMLLVQVVPVTNLTASVSGSNVTLSFAAGAGLDYSVLYKTNLTDPTWNVLTSNISAPLSWQTNTAATTTTWPITVSDTVTAHSRFYRVQSE